MRVLGLLLAASVAHGQPSQECGGGPLSANGIGPIRIGMTVDSLSRVCRILSRTKLLEHQTILIVVRIGADTVRAFEQRGRIAWMQVDSRGIRTRDSIGVGSSAASILHLPDVTGGPGDGTDTFALVPGSGPHCGLTFWLDTATAEMLNAGRGDRLRLLGMRGGGVVTQVDIHGEC